MYRSLPLRVSLALFTCGSGFGQLAPPEALSEAFQLRSRTVVGDWDGDGRDELIAQLGVDASIDCIFVAVRH